MAIGRVPGATGIQPSIVDAKGDLIAATAADSVSRLAAGSNNQVLTADSAEATGLKYANGSRATLTTTGDILYASAANTPARLGIGSTDQVLKVSGGIPAWGAAPAASFVGCALTKSASQTISNNTYTAISFDVEGIDTDAFHDNVTNNSRITIPSGKGGKYLVTGTLTFANNGTGARDAWLVKNGNVGSGGTVLTASIGIPNANNATQHYFNFVVSLVATDFIVLNVYQSSGGNLDILGNSTNAGQSTFCATYLGA